MAERYRREGHWPGVVLTDRLFEIARRDPDREVIVDPVFGRFTYAEIAAQVERLAFGLGELGVGPGDIAVVELPNWTPFAVMHLALTAIGAVTVNIPPIYREREIAYTARFTEAKVLVLPATFRGHDFLPMAAALQQELPSVRHLFLVGAGSERAGTGMIRYEEFMNRPWEARARQADLEALRPDPDAVTAIGFTSGTTGDLKGALQSSNILSAINKGFIDRYGISEADRIFVCSPVGHAVGFTHCFRMAFTVGATMVLLDRWDPAAAVDLMARERCTFSAGATPFLMDLVAQPGLARAGGLPALRLFLCGGASVPEQLVRDARRALPHTFTSPLWGMTECGGVTTCPFEAPAEKLSTTDGLPCAGMELKVVDREGQPVPAGADGELWVRGPMVALGYFRQPGLTAEQFLPDGWFRTGDQAHMDADGYIKITGRIKDLIIRGGVNISPVEIENILFAHPKVSNVAVVGMPDPRLGERVCAFVVPRASERLALAEAQEWMRAAGAARQKWPERIEHVDALPMTPSGKVQKFLLRREIQERIAKESQDAP
jgi:acyl-CoA synthetase (AMP-forming)/AMP-acid ligase II